MADTPTDVEADFEDEELTPTYSKPRRGKLLSSAIGSWKSMSGSRGDKQKYTRSMTAPIDNFEENTESSHVVNSLSASQLPPLPPRPESTPAEPNQSNSNENDSTDTDNQANQVKTKSQQVFIKRPKKYRAPQPPTNQSGNKQQTKNRNDESSPTFKLDSKPMMRIKSEPEKELKQCVDCKDYFTIEDYAIHKVSRVMIK